MIGLLAALSAGVEAHPFQSDEYSYRTAVKVSDEAFVGLVVLEVPIPVVLTSIGVEEGDSGPVKKLKVKKYNESVWDTMGEALTVSIDGAVQDVTWRPISHEMNGKAAEGFFLYLVQTDIPASELPASGYTVTIENTGYADEKMVYSGGASAVEPWSVTSSTADELLGDKKALALDQPGRWTRDDGMRTFAVTVAK
ncbi:MAG: hypothetical protein GY913_04880 [Proteobacteria bacterium]|nr:hypothetical protein [Pseudomonadota bacterium]MCP4916236.1 hypothetical protein [Pseudomonadota bacterium]